MAGFPPRMGFPPPMMGMSSPPMMGMPPPMFGGPPPPMGFGGPPPPMGFGGPPPPMGFGGPPPARQQPPPQQQQQQQQSSPRAAAAPAPAAGGAATGGWEEHKAPDGRTYYYHSATKKSTWDKPAEMKSPGEAACPWKEYTSSDGSGKKYYYNTQTKKSVWVMPDELKRIKEAAAMQAEEKKSEEAEKRRQEAESAKAMAEAKAKAQARAEQKAKEEAAEREAEEEKRKKELAANPPPASQAVAGGKKTEPGSYATKEDARAAFKQLLSDKEVGGTWSWAKAMGAIITDPRYNALKTIGEKKHVFGEWASKRAVEEKVEKRNRSRRAREAFVTMLREQAEAGAVGASARAADVQRLLEGDPRWAAVESSHDRQEMVAEHLRELQHRERDAERQQRKLSSKRFEAALRAKEWLSGAPPTSWRRVEEEFRSEEVFTSMRREDRLQVFQDVIGALERSAAQQARAQARREERRARERFRELLAEHSGPGSTGRITALSRWAECRTWLREDARWLPTDGRAGSLACELFDDVVEEQEAELRKNIERATPLLAAAGVALSAATTLEQVRAVLLPPTAAGEEAASGGPLVDEATLPLLHGAMVREAERREKQAARAQARTAERYLALLKDYSKQKDITVESSWDAETIELLSAHSSYKALGEDERKSLFEGFVVKLAAKKKEKEERRAEKKAKKAAKKAAKKHHRHSDSGSGSDSDGGGGGKRARSDAK